MVTLVGFGSGAQAVRSMAEGCEAIALRRLARWDAAGQALRYAGKLSKRQGPDAFAHSWG